MNHIKASSRLRPEHGLMARGGDALQKVVLGVDRALGRLAQPVLQQVSHVAEQSLPDPSDEEGQSEKPPLSKVFFHGGMSLIFGALAVSDFSSGHNTLGVLAASVAVLGAVVATGLAISRRSQS